MALLMVNEVRVAHSGTGEMSFGYRSYRESSPLVEKEIEIVSL